MLLRSILNPMIIIIFFIKYVQNNAFKVSSNFEIPIPIPVLTISMSSQLMIDLGCVLRQTHTCFTHMEYMYRHNDKRL